MRMLDWKNKSQVEANVKFGLEFNQPTAEDPLKQGINCKNVPSPDGFSSQSLLYRRLKRFL